MDDELRDLAERNDSWLKVFSVFIDALPIIYGVCGFIYAIVDSRSITSQSHFDSSYGSFGFESHFGVFILWIFIFAILVFFHYFFGKLILSYLADIKLVRIQTQAKMIFKA